MSCFAWIQGGTGKMLKEIYIIDDDESSILVFNKLFENDKEYKFISVK